MSAAYAPSEEYWVSKAMHRVFVQEVQQVCIDYGLKHRIKAEYYRDPAKIERSEPVLRHAHFEVYYGTWRRLALEISPMTPTTEWRIDRAGWQRLLFEIAGDISK